MKRLTTCLKTTGAATMLSAAVLMSLSSCNHKDLMIETELRSDLEVVYDWVNAPDANPASMELRLHPIANPTAFINFIFRNRDGGHLDAPVGNYAAIGLNADLTDWAQRRDEDDPDRFTLYTADAVNLEHLGLPTRSLPRATGAEEERMAQTPGMVWADRVDNVSIHSYAGQQTITLYPSELVCHYTVDVLNVGHFQYLNGEDVDATLSGMAEGVNVGKGNATDEPVTMTFTLSPDEASSSLHAEFLTFGEPNETKRPHTLSFYLTLDDGTAWHFTADVSDQIYDAPDFRHVHIIVSNLDVPKPIGNGGGLIPDVDEWQSVEIGLKM